MPHLLFVYQVISCSVCVMSCLFQVSLLPIFVSLLICVITCSFPMCYTCFQLSSPRIYTPLFPCFLCQTIAHPLVSLSSLCSSRVFLAHVRLFILWPCLLHEPWIDCFQIGDYCLFFDHYSTLRFCTSASANIIPFTQNPCCQILILEFWHI